MIFRDDRLSVCIRFSYMERAEGFRFTIPGSCDKTICFIRSGGPVMAGRRMGSTSTPEGFMNDESFLTSEEELYTDELVSVIQEDGTANELDPGLPEEMLHRMYACMVLNRELDNRMFTLQRQGRIGFYLTSTGEEAAVVGSAAALNDEDWLVPAYRESGLAIWRGVDLVKYVSQMFGNAYDNVKGRQMPNHYSFRELRMLSISSPVGTQIPQAAGFGWAAKIVGDPIVVCVYFGDGATSEGDFHVGLNFAGVFKTPTIFFCRNNQWAISVPRERQTAAKTIAIKALAYGIRGVRVDGNDILAVYRVTREAADRARNGGGPTLIEAVTYRMGAHSSSDDPRRYRPDDEVEQWRRRDPIKRFREYLEHRGLWDDDRESALMEDIQEKIQSAIKEAEAIDRPAIETMFEDVYARSVWHIEEQKTMLLNYLKERDRWLS